MGSYDKTKSREDNMIHEGDLFQLGTHHLICGDSTQPSTYKELIQNNKIDLVITDPPYGVDYGEKNKHLTQIGKGNQIENTIINDNITDYPLFFKKVFECWKQYLNTYNSIYIYRRYSNPHSNKPTNTKWLQLHDLPHMDQKQPRIRIQRLHEQK